MKEMGTKELLTRFRLVSRPWFIGFGYDGRQISAYNTLTRKVFMRRKKKKKEKMIEKKKRKEKEEKKMVDIEDRRNIKKYRLKNRENKILNGCGEGGCGNVIGVKGRNARHKNKNHKQYKLPIELFGKGNIQNSNIKHNGHKHEKKTRPSTKCYHFIKIIMT